MCRAFYLPVRELRLWRATTLIRGGADVGKWQERLCVVELPHGASTIAAEVWRWPLKSEERDNRPLWTDPSKEWW